MNSDLTGHLLIAVPEMDEPSFSRTVILLIHHSMEQGAMGVILNRPLNLSMKEVWANVSQQALDAEGAAHWGGPVQGPLVLLHREMAFADYTVLPGLYVSTQRENVEATVAQAPIPLRFFLGYSGWGPGQLEREYAEGGWFLLPPDSDVVFTDPYLMWKHCCSQVGHQILHADPRLRSLSGHDPRLN